MALYKSLILFMPPSRYSERYTLAITMCHHARAMQCVSLSVILSYLHGVHPCRFCLPRQVSHLQFLVNGVRNIDCNCSKFREITPLSPAPNNNIFPSVSCDSSSWKQSCIHDAAKGNGQLFSNIWGTAFSCIRCCGLLFHDSKKIQCLFLCNSREVWLKWQIHSKKNSHIQGGQGAQVCGQQPWG